MFQCGSTPQRRRENTLIDESVVETVLGVALRTGGEFAEVFAEDRRGSRRPAGRRPGRGPGLGPRPGRRDPGGGRGDHRVRPHQRPERGRACERRRRRPRRRPARAAAGSGRWPLQPVSAPAPNEVTVLPERVAKADKVELLRRADEAARAAGGADPPGVGRLRRQPAPDPGGQQRRRAGPRRPGQDPLRGVVRGQRRHRHADRAESRSGPPWASSCSTA